MRHDEESAPLIRFVDLSVLSQGSAKISIAPRHDDLAALAKWVDVSAVERFEAIVTLKKLSQTRFAYSADFRADVVQACVVTLEPVVSRIERHFIRELHLVAGKTSRQGGAADFDGGMPLNKDDAPEEISDPRYDVAAPLLEEFILSIDPYPRRDSVEFSELHQRDEKPENPFAVLKRLANRD